MLEALNYVPYRNWLVGWHDAGRLPDKANLKLRVETFLPGVNVRVFSPAKSPEAHLPTLVVHGRSRADIFREDFCSRKMEEFCIAHELGHYILHSKRGQVPCIFPRVSGGDHDREATVFAAYVCLGAEIVDQMWEDAGKSLLGAAKLASKAFRNCRYMPPGPTGAHAKRKRNKFWRPTNGMDAGKLPRS